MDTLDAQRVGVRGAGRRWALCLGRALVRWRAGLGGGMGGGLGGGLGGELVEGVVGG